MQKVNESKRGALSLLVGFIAVSLLILLSSINAANPMDNQESNRSMQSSSSETFEGILNIVWGDPHPEFGSGGETRYSLALLDGTSVPLQLTGQDNVAAYCFGKRVVVSGRVVPNQFGKTNTQEPWAILVDTITPSQTQQKAQDTTASVFGSKKVIYLLLKFSDDTAVPHPPNFYTDLNNPDTPPSGEVFPATINGFFKKTSWNQISWIADVGGMGGIGAPGGWLTLPHPKSYYAPCGWSGMCTDSQSLGDDGTALGRAQGITFTNYDNVNFVLSNDLDCCAWGGGYYSSVDGRSYGATWEPPWGQEAGTYSHEMGHSIGLPHSGWVYYAYDSPWDMMSSRTAANNVICGSYNSTNSGGSSQLWCSEPGDGYIAGHKDYLGWIPLANEVVTDTSSTLTVTLEADALPLSTATKIIKICITGSPCTGSSAHYFTVEARVQGLGATSQFDNGIPGEGIIIHDFQMDRPSIGGPCFWNSQSGWAQPIDSTPGDYDSVNCNPGGRSYPNYALYNAQWSPGQTFIDDNTGLTVQVVSRTGAAFVVAVNPMIQGPPTVITKAATDVGLSTATLHGRVNPNGYSTTAYYEWGTSTSYGKTTGTQPVGSGYLNLEVTANLTGLTFGGTTYHYRLVATSSAGTVRGNDSTLTTLPYSSCWTTPHFGSAVNYAVGSYPWSAGSAALGDFNGDGKLDLVVANYMSANVSILLGNGDGTFQSAVNYAVGGGPFSAAVGDFDGDGKLDLAVADAPDNVSILLGNGNGTFQSAVNYAVGGWPFSAAVGDFNGDGKLDLAVANNYSNNVSILLGNGNGTFQSAVNYAVGSGPYSVVVGDFNGDGKLDLAVANEASNNVSILLGNGNGTFQSAVDYAVESQPFSAAVGDFNGDGKLDLAVPNAASNNVSILLGNGNGTFQSAVNYTGENWPFSVAVADFNRDGKLDMAVANQGSSNASVSLGNGDGSFQSLVNYKVGSIPASVIVGDFNGDGKPDMAVANYSSNNVSILLNTRFNDCSTITLTPSSLPGGVLGQSYSQAIAASGGTEPYGYALGGGPLPTGIALSSGGVLSGTPTAAGRFGFTVTATDANGAPGSKTYSLTVLPSYEADVAPRPTGNGTVTLTDWVQVGRFAAGLDTATPGIEFQKADCAPKSTFGDGHITLTDWVQAGRYAAGLDPVVAAGGPTGPPPSKSARGSRTSQPNREGARAKGGAIRWVEIPSQVADTVETVVEIDAIGNENAMAFSVNFDPALLTFEAVSLGKDASEGQLNLNENELRLGHVGVMLALRPGESFHVGQNRLLRMVLKINPKTTAPSAVISFGDEPVLREVSDVMANALTGKFVISSPNGIKSGK